MPPGELLDDALSVGALWVAQDLTERGRQREQLGALIDCAMRPPGQREQLCVLREAFNLALGRAESPERPGRINGLRVLDMCITEM